ncbi:interleukin-11 [Esox lucius]|uniref:interleukin-11 n=1 Tax=Esox lucius TaxID=8010 RepID=UPI000973389C|nr:interleukin-11 [Esox lucius]
MKLPLDSVRSFLRLLVLAHLIVLSWSWPTIRPVCDHLKLMSTQMKSLRILTRDLKKESEISSMEYKLDTLPEMKYTADHLRSLKLNDSLLQLYKDLSSFKLHIDWLINIQGNTSPVKSEEVSKVLQRILHLCNTTLKQIVCPIPLISKPSLPTQLQTWDVAILSNEILERLLFSCDWSIRVLSTLWSQTHCR